MLRLLSLYLLLLGVVLLDYATGKEVQVGSFYLLSIALAAWNLRLRALVPYAAVTAVAWLFATLVMDDHFARNWTLYWNTANRLCTVTLGATAVSLIKRTLDHQRGLIRELSRTSLRASQLRELLPVCRLCGTIFQTGLEQREKLRKFLGEAAAADTLGGICEDCRRARVERIARIPIAHYFQEKNPTA